MFNKKILASLLLVFLIALSVSMVSAEDVNDAVASADSEDSMASDNVDDVVSSVKQPEANTSAAIQSAISNSAAGDTIDLSNFESYDVGNTTIEVGVAEITIKGNGNTIIKGWGGPGNGIFHVSASKVTFQGIKFIDTNPNSVMTYYDNETKNAHEIKGWGIHFQKATYGLVDNCSFINFNHGVRVQQQSNDVTIKNSYFTGVTNYLRNDPLVNVEKGTKAIGVMGSQRVQIINNTFDGPVLDGVSLASGCGGCLVANNTFIGNAYAIYFGGASTAGSTISGNKFRNIGEFHGVDNEGKAVDWVLLPVISIQKSASGIYITDNEFEAVQNNILIAAEAGNTAHGGLSELGNVFVTGNKITAYGAAEVSSVTLLHILARGGELNPVGPIEVNGNTLNGAKNIVYWNTQWGTENGNAIIPEGSLANAFIVINSINGNTVVAKLVDGDSVAIDAANITYVIDGTTTGSVVTDENGIFQIVGQEGKSLSINFAPASTFAPVSLNLTIPAASQPIATTLSSSDISIKAGVTGALKINLKDINGTGIANQTVAIIVDGETLAIANTDANGTVSVSVKYDVAGTKIAYISFIDSTGKYLSSLEDAKIVVSKNAAELSASKATLKVKKAKTLKVVLKSGGKALANKVVTIKVNGKTFSGKTNSKGEASIKVKVTKKGKKTAVVSFAGDGAYNAVSKKVTYTVKK